RQQRPGERVRLREEELPEHQGGRGPIEEEVVPLDTGADEAGDGDLQDRAPPARLLSAAPGYLRGSGPARVALHLVTHDAPLPPLREAWSVPNSGRSTVARIVGRARAAHYLHLQAIRRSCPAQGRTEGWRELIQPRPAEAGRATRLPHAIMGRA